MPGNAVLPCVLMLARAHESGYCTPCTKRDFEKMADTIQEVLQAFARGELVVVTDDDDREGEGDLIVAASLCTAEKMAFIIRHTSGIVCAPITREDARGLRLDPMVAHNDSSHTTAFTVSIDYKPDGGTGISAEERASCCRALANPNAGRSEEHTSELQSRF